MSDPTHEAVVHTPLLSDPGSIERAVDAAVGSSPDVVDGHIPIGETTVGKILGQVAEIIESTEVAGANVDEANVVAGSAAAAKLNREIPSYPFSTDSHTDGAESDFFDREEGPFLGWLEREGLPQDASDAAIAAHMEEKRTESVLHPDYYKPQQPPTFPPPGPYPPEHGV